eukprot:TRINITY_DN46242_c0_g1_i1.p1 TRINITY_DN46242_c0_g1~~TRINITY_DN46242_c0_g1_i1.p1  ORF type:complete len:128 (-),score=8.07 TRINITY_DN46242_c0_g1_i1:129-512(-)
MPILSHILPLLLILHTGYSLKCYSDQLERIVKCDENLGYRTCFTRYSERGEITGRGCSTKDKVYYKECETNSYGAGTEKFCYCNFYLCNGAASTFLRASRARTLLEKSAWIAGAAAIASVLNRFISI